MKALVSSIRSVRYLWHCLSMQLRKALCGWPKQLESVTTVNDAAVIFSGKCFNPLKIHPVSGNILRKPSASFLCLSSSSSSSSSSIYWLNGIFNGKSQYCEWWHFYLCPFHTAASKEYLTNRQVIFRHIDWSFTSARCRHQRRCRRDDALVWLTARHVDDDVSGWRAVRRPRPGHGTAAAGRPVHAWMMYV